MLTKEDNLMYPHFCIVKETYYLKHFCKGSLKTCRVRQTRELRHSGQL